MVVESFKDYKFRFELSLVDGEDDIFGSISVNSLGVWIKFEF